MLLALVVMWGSSFGLTKIAVSTASADSVVAARLFVAGLFLVVVVLASGKRIPRDGRAWLAFMAMAVLGNVLPYWLITWGQETVESGLAGVLMAVMPLVTLVLAHVFVKDDRMTRRKTVGFLLGFLGVVVLMGPGVGFGLAGSGGALLAQLAIIAGAVCYAVNTIIARHCPESDSLIAAAGTAIAANLLLVPISWKDLPAVVGSFDLASFLAVAILGVVSTALAPILYFHLIRRAGPTFFSLTNYLIPVWALLIGIVFLEESPGWTAFAGMALILGGIAVSQLAKGRGPATRQTGTTSRVPQGYHRPGPKSRRSGRSDRPEAWQLASGEAASRAPAGRQVP
ncbi:MAG: DMT family transporter [Kiloniellales bacterium]|nr:DMT family transporter [Kiloniellales bacterium]